MICGSFRPILFQPAWRSGATVTQCMQPEPPAVPSDPPGALALD